MFKKILSVGILLSLALVTLAEVTADDIQNTEAQLRDLIQKMETDQLNYDLYKQQYDELKIEYDAMKRDFAQSQASDQVRAGCKGKYNDANSALRLRNYDDARALLDQAISDCPDMASLYLGRAIARKGLSDFQGAEADYMLALEKSEDCATIANYNLGTLYINNLNRVNDGIARLRLALECDSTYHKAWYQLGKVKLDQRQTTEAANCFTSAIDHDPSYTRAAIELAKIQLNTDCRAAVATLSSAQNAARDNSKSQLYQLLAQAHNNCGQASLAIQAADQGIGYLNKLRQNKSYISGALHWEKARALQAQENWQEAVDELREAARSREWRQNAEYEIENRIIKDHPEVN
jgi:predicted Zn-dependent protease